jgi:hypothetical protein
LAGFWRFFFIANPGLRGDTVVWWKNSRGSKILWNCPLKQKHFFVQFLQNVRRVIWNFLLKSFSFSYFCKQRRISTRYMKKDKNYCMKKRAVGTVNKQVVC